MPLDFFLRRYGISRTTVWRWRKNGLPTLQVGAKIFCFESDFILFLQKMDGQTVNATRLKSQTKTNP